MHFLWDSIRRLLTAALVIALLTCAVEVALRLVEPSQGALGTPTQWPLIPRLASRTTRLELPCAWTGDGLHVETGELIPLRVNSLGVRGPEIHWTKPVGTLRIVCLGDEATLADGLPEQETYAGRLAILLHGRIAQPIEVINAGLPDGSPLTELIQYRRQLERLQPDLVLLHVDLSDAADDLAARRALRLDESGLPAAVLHPTLDVAPSALAEWSGRFAIAGWFERQLGGRFTGEHPQSGSERFQQSLLAWNPVEDSEQRPAVLEPIAQLQTLLEHRGARLIVSTFPTAWQAAELLRSDQARGGGNELLTRPARVLTQTARQLGIASLDVTPLVLRRSHPAELYLPGDGGLSSEGHALYAAELVRLLTSPGEFPAAANLGSPSGR